MAKLSSGSEMYAAQKEGDYAEDTSSRGARSSALGPTFGPKVGLTRRTAIDNICGETRSLASLSLSLSLSPSPPPSVFLSPLLYPTRAASQPSTRVTAAPACVRACARARAHTHTNIEHGAAEEPFRSEVHLAYRHAGTRPHVQERTPNERHALIELVFCVSRLLDYD